MKILSLNGEWDLSGPENIATTGNVPGCVHVDLLNADLIPDPYYKDNETRLQWIGESDWSYEREFLVDEELLAFNHVFLCSEGLDTFASIEVNGSHLGVANNMFRKWEWDLKPLLRIGANRIRVNFASTIPYASKNQEERFLEHTGIGHHRISGGNWVRKEQCNYGWDWGPMLVTCGIWRDISIVAFDTARIDELHIRQTHRESVCSLDIAVSAEVDGEDPLAVRFEVMGRGELVSSTSGELIDGEAESKMTIRNPELWWPNGMGEQPLYTVKASIIDNAGKVLDSAERRIGLRTLELIREGDEWGESFGFAANGKSFFAKGANWIPADTFDARATDEAVRDLLESAKEANMNMIRVWGGGVYERDSFYDACDELGLCIWQDFMFGCSAYPAFDDEFVDNVRIEAEQNVKRIRHHACLSLWCGNNELEQIHGLIGDTPGAMSWMDYERLFDGVLAEVVSKCDPDTAYWPSSEHSPVGDRSDSSNPDCGDAHLWKVWHGREPFEWYRTSFHRFCSEFGFQSFPHPRTIETYTDPEDRNITSHVMEFHQRSPIGNSAIIDYMLSWFRLPTGYESSVWLSQLLQALAIKYAVEHWRRNVPRCMGALYWQLNDCWPVAGWASIDSDHRWKALHFEAKRFFAPLMVSAVEDIEARKVEVFVSNDEHQEVSGSIRWTITDTDGVELLSGALDFDSVGWGSSLIVTLDLADLLEIGAERRLIAWIELEQNGEIVSRNLAHFARPKHMELRDPELDVIIEEKGANLDVLVTAKRPALWTWLDHERIDTRLSDNFIHLKAGETRRIRIVSASMDDPEKLKSGWIARSVWGTYQ